MRTKIIGLLLIGLTLSASNGITPAELKKRIDAGEKITIVDVRHTEIYQQGHIPGAINIPSAICDQKRAPGNGLIVVYDGGLGEDLARSAVQKLKTNQGARIEVLEGGFAGWETFVGLTTKQAGAKREETPYITYETLKKIQSADTVIVDLREPSKKQSNALAGNQTQPQEQFTDLQSEFPKAKVVRSPFAGGVSKKSLSAVQYSPLYVLVDKGDGKAQEMARMLKANGINRYVILAGGEKILERQGKAGLQRSGSSFTVPAAIGNKNNQ